MSSRHDSDQIPPHLHRRLKAQAKRHKRSLNQEAILCLGHAVGMDAARPSLATPPPPVSVGSILQPWSSRAELLENFLDRESIDGGVRLNGRCIQNRSRISLSAALTASRSGSSGSEQCSKAWRTSASFSSARATSSS